MSNLNYDWDQGAWKILKLLMNEPTYLVQHQINSFNYFLDNNLKVIIEQFNTITLNYDFVDRQNFFRVLEASIYSNDNNKEWCEYNEISDIFIIYKKQYLKSNKTSKLLDLNLNNKNDDLRKIKLETDFNIFVKNHLEFKVINVNKHRYDLELNIEFKSISPPIVYENNGSHSIMYPNEARLRNFTYSGDIYIDIHFKTIKRFGMGLKSETKPSYNILRDVKCGKLPIMLGSRLCILSNITNNRKIDYEECKYDEGGYFIINGTEKSISISRKTGGEQNILF